MMIVWNVNADVYGLEPWDEGLDAAGVLIEGVVGWDEGSDNDDTITVELRGTGITGRGNEEPTYYRDAAGDWWLLGWDKGLSPADERKVCRVDPAEEAKRIAWLAEVNHRRHAVARLPEPGSWR